MSYWRSKDFKALQAAWYGVLAADGFCDAEEPVGDDLELKQAADHAIRLAAPDAREAYFYMLQQKVGETTFKREVDRIILTRHAEGYKICHIVSELEALGMRRCRNAITFRIRVYQKRWGLRHYTRKQLNLKAS